MTKFSVQVPTESNLTRVGPCPEAKSGQAGCERGLSFWTNKWAASCECPVVGSFLFSVFRFGSANHRFLAIIPRVGEFP